MEFCGNHSTYAAKISFPPLAIRNRHSLNVSIKRIQIVILHPKPITPFDFRRCAVRAFHFHGRMHFDLPLSNNRQEQ